MSLPSFIGNEDEKIYVCRQHSCAIFLFCGHNLVPRAFSWSPFKEKDLERRLWHCAKWPLAILKSEKGSAGVGRVHTQWRIYRQKPTQRRISDVVIFARTTVTMQVPDPLFEEDLISDKLNNRRKWAARLIKQYRDIFSNISEGAAFLFQGVTECFFFLTEIELHF